MKRKGARSHWMRESSRGIVQPLNEFLVLASSICVETMWKERNAVVHGENMRAVSVINGSILSSMGVYWSALEAVARGEHSDVLAVESRSIHCVDPLVAEGHAMLLGMDQQLETLIAGVRFSGI
ncbi:hypothetical protein PanWU01x14_096290, partial [Parasponia andersonii]